MLGGALSTPTTQCLKTRTTIVTMLYPSHRLLSTHFCLFKVPLLFIHVPCFFVWILLKLSVSWCRICIVWIPTRIITLNYVIFSVFEFHRVCVSVFLEYLRDSYFVFFFLKNLIAGNRRFSSNESCFLRGHQINIKQVFGLISRRAPRNKAGSSRVSSIWIYLYWLFVKF